MRLKCRVPWASPLVEPVCRDLLLRLSSNCLHVEQNPRLARFRRVGSALGSPPTILPHPLRFARRENSQRNLSAESHGQVRSISWQDLGMRIVVSVKHVPDADGDRRIEDGRLVRGEDDVLNELDEYAIEAAVSAVEEHGGEVIAVTMGPEDSEDALTRALQMGADRGVLIADDALEGADALGTAAVLSAAVAKLGEEEPVDLVLTGMASLDGMTSMVPPAMAARLGWPLLDVAEALVIDEGDEGPRVTITRHADGYEDTLWADAPAIVSVTDVINEPRYPTFKDLRAARGKPIDELSWEDLQEFADQGIDFQRTRVVDANPREREAGVILQDSGDGGVKLAEYLFEQVSE